MSGFVRRANQTELKTATFTVRLVVHQTSYSPEEVIINPTKMAGIEVGDIIEVYGVESNQPNGERFRMLSRSETMFLSVKQQTLVPSAGSMEISILNTLADAFSFSTRQTVLIRVCAEKDSSELHAIELSFRNQYIGRADMWRVKDFLTSECIYAGKALDVEGMRIKIDKMAYGASKVLSGCVTDTTTLTFRSLTARVFFLIHLSSEMWDFAEDGEMYFEKVVGFLKVLFQEWSRLQVSHVISIIFFSRTHFEKCADENCCVWEENPENMPETPMLHPNNVLQLNKSTGYLYQDHYKVVLELDMNGYKQWEKLLVHIKTEFQQYDTYMGWGSHTASGLRGYPATASEGNVLEAVNMTLSIYEKHYVDRALTRTGQNMLMICAGSGFFNVDKSLSRLTKDRMVDAGVACDLICVTRAPLHHVPLFKPRLFVNTPNSNNSSSNAHTSHTSHTSSHISSYMYEIPEWLSIVFYDYQDYFEKPFGVPSPHQSMQQMRENVLFLSSRGICNTFSALPSSTFSSSSSSPINTAYASPFSFFSPGVGGGGGVPVKRMGPVLPNAWDNYDDSVFSADSLSIHGRPPSAERPRRIPLLDIFNPNAQILVSDDQRDLNRKILEKWQEKRQVTPYTFTRPDLSLIDGSQLGMEAGRSSAFERVTTQGHTHYLCIEWVDVQIEPAIQKQEAPTYSSMTSRRSSGGGNTLALTRSVSEKDITQTKVGSFEGENSISTNTITSRGSQMTLYTNTNSQTMNSTLAAALLSNLRSMIRQNEDETTSFSPFEPSTIPSVEALNRDRWGNLYGYKLDIRRLSFEAKPAKLSEFSSANWKSLCKPAILPLTSSKWCTPPELSKEYVEYVYVLYVDSGPDGMGLENVLSELICQRLAHDYQQAVPPKQQTVKETTSILMKKQLKESYSSNSNNSNSSNSNSNISGNNKKDNNSNNSNNSSTNNSNSSSSNNNSNTPTTANNNNRKQQTYYFTSHNQFHQITVDNLQGFIRVTRCVHKRTLNRFLVKIPYRSFLYSPLLKCFHLTDRDMEAAPDSFDWNKMDNLLASGDDEFSDETMLRSKRIRYALIPPCAPQQTGPFRPPLNFDSGSSSSGAGGSSSSSSSGAGGAGGNSSGAGGNSSGGVCASSGSSNDIGGHASSSSSSIGNNGSNSASNNSSSSSCTVSNGASGSGRGSYNGGSSGENSNSNSSSGSSSCDGSNISSSSSSSNSSNGVSSGSHSRRDSQNNTHDMLRAAANAVAAVSKGGGGAGGGDTEESLEKTIQNRAEAMSTFAQGLCNKTLDQLKVVMGGGHSHATHMPAPPSRPRRAPTDQKKNADVKSRLDQGFAVRGNRCQNVDVKLKKTTTKFGVRQEWLRIQFDAMYDPEKVFQLQIQWLVASGLHVEEWILKNFFRKGKALKDLGIQIVTIPANQSMRSADAYHTALEIPMPNILHRDIARRYLLSYCGFVKEMCQEPGRLQYMHCTGISIVREFSSGFVWVDNNLMQMFQDPSPGLHIYIKFSQLCQRIHHVSSIVESLVNKVTG